MVTTILAALTATEFIFIFYLETLATISPLTAKTFGMDVQALKNPNMKAALKNQGVYNLGIAALIVAALLLPPVRLMLVCVMAYILVVAAYGSVTVDKWIIVKQGGLAALTLLSMLI